MAPKHSRRVRLTDRFVDALKAPPKGAPAADYPDEMTPGLVLRVTPAGVKSWGLRFRTPDGKPTRKVLGPYPAVKLSKARGEAAKLREKIRDGIDITARPPSIREGVTFATVVDRWERRHKRLGKRSVAETRRILDLHVVPSLGDRLVETVRKRDVIEILERLRDEQGFGAQVNRVQRAVSGALAYAVDADLIEVNPLAGLKPQVVEKARERVLSLDELAKVWTASEAISATGRAAVRLLILTGQRREEVTGMAWSELDYDHKGEKWASNGLWTIPAARMKANRDHVVPLSPAAREIIAAQPKGAAGDFVFSATFGRTSFAGWRRAAMTLRDKAKLKTPWIIHDLRRSCATGLGEILNIEESIIGRTLGHSPRSRMGITARYELSQRLAQVRAALDAWASLVVAHVDGKAAGNVVPLPAGRAKA